MISDQLASPPRRIFASHFLAGMFCLLVGAPPWGGMGSALLFGIGAVYVVVGGWVFARVYSQPAMSRRRELAALGGVWLGACVIWTVLVSDIGSGASVDRLGVQVAQTVGFGTFLGTVLFLVWQIAALIIRQLILAATRRKQIRAGSRPR